MEMVANMRKQIKKGIVCTGVFLAATMSIQRDITAEEWSQWRGPNRDAISEEIGLLSDWSHSEPKLVWQASGLGTGYSSVVVSHDRVFTIGRQQEDLFCIALNRHNGRQEWIRKVGVTSRIPCSTPTLDDDRIYVLDPDGELLCLDTETGATIWERGFMKDFEGRMQSGRGYGESPLIDGQTLICTPGGAEAMFVALNKYTGDLIWKSRIPDLGMNGRDGAGFSSIVITEAGGIRQYVQLVGRGLVGINADNGRFLWGYNRIANRTANIPTPVVYSNRVFAANGYHAGSVLLELHPDGNEGIEAREVYFLSGGRFQNHHGGFVLIDGYVYGGHGSNNGLPTCVNLETGKLSWKRRGPGTGSASVIFADGHLYFRYQNGVMALIEANPEGYHFKGAFQIPGAGGDSWAHPAIAHGRLFLREKDHLYVYSIKQETSLAGGKTRNTRLPDFSSPLVNKGVSVRLLESSRDEKWSKQSIIDSYLLRDRDSSEQSPVMLSLTDRELTQEGLIPGSLLKELAVFPASFILDLSGTRVGDAALADIARLSNLKGLKLEFCQSLTDQGLTALKEAAQLRILVLTGTGITDSGVSGLSSWSNLQVLDLELCDGVTDVSCTALGAMRDLQVLILRKSGFESERITDSGMRSLQQLTQLEVLDLYGNRVTDSGLHGIKNWNNLRVLNLSLLPITDSGLFHLSTLKQLRCLQLVYSEGVAGPIVSNKGLQALLKLERLEWLDLTGASINDDGLLQLSPLQMLNRMKLENTAVTDVGIRQFNALVPSCRITH